MDTNPLFESWDNCAYYPHTDSNSDSFDTVGREPFCSFESFWNGQEITKNISDNCKINCDIFRGKGNIKRENCKHLKGRESVWELNMNCHFSSLCEWKRKERGWKDWKVWKRKRDSKYHLSPTSELASSSKVGTAVQSPVSFKVEQRWPQVEFCRALVKVVADVVQSRFVFQYENVEVSLNLEWYISLLFQWFTFLWKIESVHRSLTKWGILNGKSIECFSVNLQNSRRSRHNCNALPPQCHTVTIFCVTKPPWASIHSIALVHPQLPWVDQTAVDLPTFLKQYFNSQPSCCWRTQRNVVTI